MTLVFALQGKDEIVVAADSMAHDGPDTGGSYKLSVKKLLPVRGNWLLGFSGDQDGYTIYKHIKAQNWESNLSSDINLGADEYARKMRDTYDQTGCRGRTTLLLCGVSNGEPATYTWSLGRDSHDQVEFSGAQTRPERAGIGAGQHGALYFASAFHRREMDTRQRMLLAHFCVSEAAKLDPRLGGHVDLALVKENSPVRFFSQDELVKVQLAGEKIFGLLTKRFAAAGPPIMGRLGRSEKSSV